jgi:hypothetical protein
MVGCGACAVRGKDGCIEEGPPVARFYVHGVQMYAYSDGAVMTGDEEARSRLADDDGADAVRAVARGVSYDSRTRPSSEPIRSNHHSELRNVELRQTCFNNGTTYGARPDQHLITTLSALDTQHANSNTISHLGQTDRPDRQTTEHARVMLGTCTR